MSNLARRLAFALTGLLLALPDAALSRAAPAPLSSEDWREDLAFVVEKIESDHPRPWGRISRDEFLARAADLDREMATLGDAERVSGLMEIAALIRDGHTRVSPEGSLGFPRWLPVRFRTLQDGVFVTVAPESRPELLGARLERIGGLAPQAAFDRLRPTIAADNEFWRGSRFDFWLSNADLLAARGIVPSSTRVTLDLITRGGERLSVELASEERVFGTGWYWRQLGGPPGGPYVHAFAGSEAPLHLREQASTRKAYWFDYSEETGTLYFQWVGFWDREPETFVEFSERMWQFVDRVAPRRFVLDLRYNAGGNGALFTPFLNEFIKRDWLNQPDRLFTLLGPRSFSASVLAVGELRKHTRTTFVGEPMGAGLNSNGDARSYSLPHTGLTLYVSTIHWQTAHPADAQEWFSPHVPAPFTSVDFFAGEDPALARIEAGEALPIPFLFENRGAPVALAALEERRAVTADLGWWVPFTERELNSLGYRLVEKGRLEDGIAALELNALTYPDSDNVWDSLAEAQMVAGRLELAVELYEKSLAINPGNGNATHMIERLREQIAARAAD